MNGTTERRIALIGVAALFGAGLGACAPQQVTGNATLPPNVPDPHALENRAGAVAAYYGTLAVFAQTFGGAGGLGGSVVLTTGLLSDELQDGGIGEPIGATTGGTALDSRALPEIQDLASDNGLYTYTYAQVQRVRGQAEEARGLLAQYGGDSLRALRGHVDALEGYAETFLADLFCSGIPLSTVDYAGDYTLRPGSSTQDVYQHAVTLFDSAVALAGDSARILNLARVGLARALLALGQYAQAGQAVAAVPDGFAYAATYSAQPFVGVGENQDFAWVQPSQSWSVTTVDREGVNGLAYISSNDPRTASSAIGTNVYGRTLLHPNKYATDGSSPIAVGDWVEARLIEAEVALQAGDVATWLAKLNHLRQTAISPALPDTTDPGAAGARVDLLFRERAFWLFLTGHRQGDLRRLIRQYGRSPNQVYPTGGYPGGSGRYGSDVTAPVPVAERLYNPLYSGCMSRGA